MGRLIDRDRADNLADKCGASRGAAKRLCSYGRQMHRSNIVRVSVYTPLFTVWTLATAMHSLRLELYIRYAICMALMAVVSVLHHCITASIY